MLEMKSTPATDSARELRKIAGDDATAEFENDPKFIDSNPTGSASSENLAVQRDTDDTEDSEEEVETEDEDEDDEDVEDEDEEVEDEEDEEEDEDDEDEEEDDEDIEDDEDEVGALAA
jgi:hypothetical protein